MGYDFSENSVTEEITEEHPEGGDRGGYQVVTHEVSVDGDTLTYSLSNSDDYENFEVPEPLCNSREEALNWIEGAIGDLRGQLQRAEAFLAIAQATTKFKADKDFNSTP